MSAAVLSRHVVSVPPRQTVRMSAYSTRPASQIALVWTAWEKDWGKGRDPHASRRALWLRSPESKEESLAIDGNHLTLQPAREIRVEIGNCADETLMVEIEIRGDS